MSSAAGGWRRDGRGRAFAERQSESVVGKSRKRRRKSVAKGRFVRFHVFVRQPLSAAVAQAKRWRRKNGRGRTRSAGAGGWGEGAAHKETAKGGREERG